MQIFEHKDNKYLSIKDHHFQILNGFYHGYDNYVYIQCTTNTSSGIVKEYLPDGWELIKKRYNSRCATVIVDTVLDDVNLKVTKNLTSEMKKLNCLHTVGAIEFQACGDCVRLDSKQRSVKQEAFSRMSSNSQMIFTLYKKSYFSFKSKSKSLGTICFLALSKEGSQYLLYRWILNEKLELDDTEDNIKIVKKEIDRRIGNLSQVVKNQKMYGVYINMNDWRINSILQDIKSNIVTTPTFKE